LRNKFNVGVVFEKQVGIFPPSQVSINEHTGTVWKNAQRRLSRKNMPPKGDFKFGFWFRAPGQNPTEVQQR
jgi:hypothetical protein